MSEKIPKGFEGLTRHIAKDVYKKIGNKMAKDMAHTYYSAIRSFYKDYHPRIYARKYRSYYFADPNGVKRFTKFVKKDADGKGFTVGMNITSRNIFSPYRSLVGNFGSQKLTDMVFYNTFVLGQHGGRMPFDILPEEDRPYLIFNGSSRWTFYGGYGWVWEPPVMDNPPKSQMDAWFKKYATNENLDKLTKNIVTNSINSYLRRHENKYGESK